MQIEAYDYEKREEVEALKERYKRIIMKGIKENPPPLISESKKGKRGRPRQSKAKTPQGADAFCRNRGYISTIMKNAMSVIDSLYAALKGEPPIPD